MINDVPLSLTHAPCAFLLGFHLLIYIWWSNVEDRIKGQAYHGEDCGLSSAPSRDGGVVRKMVKERDYNVVKRKKYSIFLLKDYEVRRPM